MGEESTASGIIGIQSGAQVFHSLPFVPSALIFSWAAQRQPTELDANIGGLGFAAMGSGCVETRWSSAAGMPQSQTQSYVHYAGPDDCQNGSDGGRPPTVRLQPAGFSIVWPSERPDAAVQFLAFGGVRSTCGIGVLAPSTGPQAFEEVGFMPSAVLVAPTLAEMPGAPVPGLLVGLGVATTRGQLASSYRVPNASEPGVVRAAQRSDSALLVPALDSEELYRARLECRQKGFALAWDKPASSSQPFGYLALADVDCVVGRTASTGRVGRQRISSVGVRPAAVLCFTWGLREATTSKPVGRFSLGAATDTAISLTSWDDRNVLGESTMTHAHASCSSVILVSDSQGGTAHAEATVKSLDRDGFTLDWLSADVVQREINWAAFAGSGASDGRDTRRRFHARLSLRR